MMKLFILIILFFTGAVHPQLSIPVKEDFNVIINDSAFTFSESWLDSLKLEAQQGKINYKISGFNTNTSKLSTTSKIKIPETLTLNQVIRQIILYYNLLESEKEKQNEKLLVYPFFKDTSNPEFIRCRYNDNTYFYKVRKWNTLPIPSEPSPEEKYIYNQILENDIQNNMGIFEDISDNLLKEISNNQNIPESEIRNIYQKVALWNASRQ